MTIDKKLMWSEARDYAGITFGLVLYAFGFTFFLMPYEIVTGGVAGVAAIVQYATEIPNQYTYFLVNAALLIMALRILGVKFLMKTIYAIFMLTFLLWFMKEIVPHDASRIHHLASWAHAKDKHGGKQGLWFVGNWWKHKRQGNKM